MRRTLSNFYLSYIEAHKWWLWYHKNSTTVEPLYKDTPHKDNRVSKDMDQGPDDICM